MKIGIVSNLYPPYARGGAENVVVRTVEAINEVFPEHEVFVISTHPRCVSNRTERDANTMERVYRFFPINLYHLLDDHKIPWPLRLVWHVIDAFGYCGARRVGQILDREKPDIVITHNLKGIGLRIPHAIQRRKIPHVHVMHDLQLIYPSGLKIFGKEKKSLVARAAYAVYRKICKRRIGSPNLVIFPSEYLKTAYLQSGFFSELSVEVLPNPAPRFTPEVREGREPGPLRLLFIGQLEEHKGIIFLLKAFDKLEIESRLIIAGEGTCSGKVNKYSQKNKKISYLGFVSQDQLVSCLGIADALVVPSLCYENSPTVIYEALQAGVPVLASNIGGVGELVQDGKNGFLFTPGSVYDFSRAVQRLEEQKDFFAESQAKIKETVAPYALTLYARSLVEKLIMIVDQSKSESV